MIETRHRFILSEQPRQPIQVTMPDGTNRAGTSWETSPMDIAKEVSKSLSERVVIAKVCIHLELQPIWVTFYKVDGVLWDLERPLEMSCKLELLDFENPEGEIVSLLYIKILM